MEQDVINLTSAIAEIADIEGDISHPLLTKIKFVFATDEGAKLATSRAGLKQGIKAEDFDEVIKTAINMPVKMLYLGRKKIGGHFGSVPIGHITGMTKEVIDGVNSLVAEAVLYTEEFPDEVHFLKEAFAAGEAPGISYEVRHNPTASLIENGVEWLKNLVTQAATIVKSPAYGSRTAIMALASNKELTVDEFNKELLELMKPSSNNSEGGSSNMDEKDKKIADLTQQLATASTEAQNLETELTTLRDQIKTLTEENSGLKKTALIEARLKAYTEAGLTLEADAEKADKKKNLLVDMSEEVFNTYIEDLKAAKASKIKAEASRKGADFPRFATGAGEELNLTDLKSSLRAVARGEAPSSE